MTRDPTRKAPRRKPARELDDELVDLALALDAQRLDKNAVGWFSVPWRFGWNALALAHHVAKQLDTSPVLAFVSGSRSIRRVDAEVYHQLSEFLERGGYYFDSPTAPEPMHEITRACLRCYQVIIARSDAGGEAYNTLLRPAFEKLLPETIEPIVLFWRRQDALGDADDAGRGELFSLGAASLARIETFNIAWKRGLYRAAYAV